MFKSRWAAFKTELSSYTRAEKIFTLCAMFCGFCICMDYATIRPVSNSVFIHAYGAQAFPYAWLATVPLNLLIVGLYNRFLPKWGCRRMFLSIITIVAAVSLFSSLYLKTISWLPFFYYVWKEVYVVLLFQQLWSVIHATVPATRAKYLYGLFFLAGALGGIAGSSIPGFFAVYFGSENLLLLALPVYFAMTFSYLQGIKASGIKELRSKESAPLLEGVQLIAKSRPLKFILILVLCMQMAATLTDYQFNTLLQTAYPDKDLRTAFTGQVLGLVQIFTLIFQAFGTYLLVQWLGLRGSHTLVPLFLSLGALGFLITPVFGVITSAFIAIKSFDFSLFGVIKEMLYLPLSTDEKFRAKAVIDVFVYRSAKAIASLAILLLPFASISWLTLSIFILWLFSVIIYIKPTELTTSPASE